MTDARPKFGKFTSDGHLVRRDEITSPVTSGPHEFGASVPVIPGPSEPSTATPPGPMVPVVSRTSSISPEASAPRASHSSAARPVQPSQTNGFAIAALITGIFGGSVLALTFGFIAKSQIRGSGGLQKGDGLATAGIILGILWLSAQVLFWVALISATSSY